MERKQETRRPVKTAPHVASRQRRCAQRGALTSPRDGDIRVNPEPIADPTSRVEVVETYFDATGNPIKRKAVGAERVARAYDARGNQVEEAYFSAEGKPTVRKDLGAARISWRYDDAGKRVEAALYGADGALVMPPPRGRRRGRAGV